jgi:hypothetical protein
MRLFDVGPAGVASPGLYRCLYFLKRPHLDLANSFAGYAMLCRKLFQCRRLVGQLARREDLAFTRIERREGVMQGLPAMSGLLLLG